MTSANERSQQHYDFKYDWYIAPFSSNLVHRTLPDFISDTMKLVMNALAKENIQ